MIFRLARPVAGRLLGAVLLATATELAGLSLMATATWLLMTAAGQPPVASLTVAIVAVRALAIARGALRYAERLASHDAVLRIVTTVRARVFAALVDRPAEPVRRGDALARMVSDVDAVQDLVVRVWIPACAGTLASALAVTGAVLIDPWCGVVLGAGLVLCGVVLPVLAYRLAATSTLAALRAEYAVASLDLVHGAADLAAYGARPAYEATAASISDALARLEKRLAFRAVLVDLMGSLIMALTAFSVIAAAHAAGVPGVWIGVLAVGTIAAGEVALSLTAAARRRAEIAGALDRLRPLLTTAAAPTADGRAASGGDRQDPVWITENHVIMAQDSGDFPDPNRILGAPGRPGLLEVEGVSVRYRPAGPPALADFSLTLAPGSTTALVGPSGAGKSTVLALLSGALRPDEGQVRYDGRPLPEDAYATVGGLFADAAVFHASIAENVTLGRQATEPERRDAARAAGLLDWIEAQPEGWNTIVGEDGTAMSGGQRQRLTLTRALLQAPPVVLLDEPTEGLDPAHADTVLRDVLEFLRGRTVVLVTHRTAETAGFDQVIRIGTARETSPAA
ncbi:thiol reductant ABC exporter subunit CydC [Hamadaea tsunoensis]|uniref:thiol reductant ABC exporter subunit CydC n=1 Tax=Hamadaea tsunoensis TaxID=53368 RepID=UPI0003F9A6B6|nr:thiol reductant ABC exporter subunit CydC [Hamadaea tsunoensis]